MDGDFLNIKNDLSDNKRPLRIEVCLTQKWLVFANIRSINFILSSANFIYFNEILVAK